MPRHLQLRSLLLIGTCCVAVLGCQRAKQPVPVGPIKQFPAAATVSPPTVEAPPDQAVSIPAAESPMPVVESAEASAETSATAESPAFSSERILLLAPGNPILIEFQLAIDGKPHTAALEQLVDQVRQIADADNDGRTTWKELCGCRQVKYGQYGNLPIDDENNEKQIIERYDIARDGIADRSELPRFLTRNAGGSRPFSIRGTWSQRGLNRRGAATWRALDADEDGAISSAERAQAGTRLATRDNDDDEIVQVSDLNVRPQTSDMEMMGQRRRRGSDAARLLGPHADWSAVQLSLEQEYAGGRPLRAGCFPRTPELFAQLDANHDGVIRREEFKGLDGVPVQVVIAAEFGRNQEAGSGGQGPEGKSQESGDQGQGSGDIGQGANGQPRLRLVAVDPALAGDKNNVALERNRLTIAVANTLVTFFVNDTVASDDFAARAKQSLAMFDQNKDGYLVPAELPESLQGQLGRFEAVDADGDGKADVHEIEAFLAQQQAGLRAQIHARASDNEDCLFAALDADGDDRLDSRELQAASQRLAELDANRDGELTADEVPEALTIVLARGSLENADATFAPPAAVARLQSENAPRWFTAMDANQDGVISRREFLGTADAFGQLDRDANGLLDVSEAVRSAASEH